MKIIKLLLFLFIAQNIVAQTINVDVNLNYKHTVGGVSEFDRAKFINLHASHRENDFKSSLEFMNYLIYDLDVYFGREVGTQQFMLNSTEEDSLRPGYPSLDHLRHLLGYYKGEYIKEKELHKFEERSELSICAHKDPFFPTGKKTKTGWAPKNHSATAQWYAHYIKEFFGDGGEPKPKYISIINEPEFLAGASFKEISKYHNVVADSIRKHNPDVLIGGFASAGCKHEDDNFQHWHDHYKTFMDISGSRMDFWDVHWYDDPFVGYQYLREGANLEASFDMMEQYSLLKFGYVKPFFVSEYGSFITEYKFAPYSKVRDWTSIKAYSSMLMNFINRPDQIIKAVPFMMIKAEGWGDTGDNPYPYRLLRKENEPEERSGEWEFSEFIKFYQLWANVKGERVSTYPEDPDIQTEAYVDGDKVYLILNNLDFDTNKVKINLFEEKMSKVESVMLKHLYLDSVVAEECILDTIISDMLIDEVEIYGEATVILEYTFEDEIKLGQKKDEVKYYADSYLKRIKANDTVNFIINNVEKGDISKGILRVSFGRDHGASLKPKVFFNGTELDVPTDYRGYDMKPRFRWFGALEIPVNSKLIEKENLISIEFPDEGGHISSVTFQVFNYSKEEKRSF